MNATVVGSNWLADLRERLKDEHAAVAKALKTSLMHALTAGDLLIEAKAQLKHSEWLPWLETCGLSERTCQRYMRLARNRESIEANTTTLSDLSVSGALAMLAVSRDDDGFFDDADFLLVEPLSLDEAEEAAEMLKQACAACKQIPKGSMSAIGQRLLVASFADVTIAFGAAFDLALDELLQLIFGPQWPMLKPVTPRFTRQLRV